MGALDRFDEWESSLEDHYDASTLAAIARRTGEPPRRLESRRGGLVAAVAVAGSASVGAARGFHDAFDPEPDRAQIEEAWPVPASRRLDAVTVLLVPGDPSASVAIVRRWLL